MGSSLLWDVTQRRLVVGYRRFGTTCRSQLKASNCPRRFCLYCVMLQYGPARWARHVGNYQATLRNIPQERRSQLMYACAVSRITMSRVNCVTQSEGPPVSPQAILTFLRRWLRSRPICGKLWEPIWCFCYTVAVSNFGRRVGLYRSTTK
jgi:hypothetical protein